MPTTRCAGIRSARMLSATRSFGIVERRHDDHAVGDVEIRVARGQPFAVHDDGTGKGQRARRGAARRADARMPLPGAAGCRSSARGCRRPDRASTASTTVSAADEARHVVDVAVRVVADASFAQPDRLAGCQAIPGRAARSPRASTRVPDLDVGQQPLLGDQQEAVVR